MRGTPYWFAGDEIGMRNIRFDRIEDYNDIDTINRYKKAKAEGKDPQAVLDEQKRPDETTPALLSMGSLAGSGIYGRNPLVKGKSGLYLDKRSGRRKRSDLHT